MTSLPSQTILVTGAAGFIGFHMARRLLAAGHRVIGLDALTDYYDPALKTRRLEILQAFPDYVTVTARLEEPGLLRALFERERPTRVIHLAAQAGVRYSIDEPRSYVEANLIGTFELLEAARAFPPEHMLLASTSSAYGANEKMPYAETDKADWPMSFYAATKKATEGMAHSYAHLYGLPTTMFRFFTVYGTWGRPDMALFKFTRAILTDQPIDVYNHGDMSRDFTQVDDLTWAMEQLLSAVPPAAEGRGAPLPGDSLSPVAPFRVVNIGNSAPVKLLDFIEAIERATGRSARKNMMDMQPGDVPATWADAGLLTQLIGPMPRTDLQDGVGEFVDWYRDYMRLNSA
ncbi:NAD-dependent epimerase/dehydratase family protein [Pseudooceanicola sp. HF7]|uniref:NAD-dependent epimerase/dehydratase family protein n=1 Tax=Pseudooceanicola sp. HF7 TaxID=2721560 RepID=UPI0014316D64|nr:NAD-dependent epimerase/dehydratase family protein [Pseudooceanicola sp. HF7]NIZ10843.1 SDR family NAD(P)-dependent oxidoreductase [Pseudooceanicola sp. HF7]